MQTVMSFIASSVRPHLWAACFESLAGNSMPFEVIFAGNVDEETVKPFLVKYPFFRYIRTGNIKPAQCYEATRRAAQGEYTIWIADDCEFSKEFVKEVSSAANALPNNSILSVKTNENGLHNNLDDHRFFERNRNTPLMAPLGVINTELLNQMGGFDYRYICGQYENDVSMRIWAMGGKVVKFEDACVTIDHIKKHGASTKFWSGYDHDRKVLEDTWVIGGYKPAEKPLVVFKPSASIQMQPFLPITNREVIFKPQMAFDSYSEIGLLTTSQGYKGTWE